MVTVIREGEEYSRRSVAEVVIRQLDSNPVAIDAATNIIGYTGPFTWGPEDEVLTLEDYETFFSTLIGTRHNEMNDQYGIMDMYTMFQEGAQRFRIVRKTGGSGSAVAATKTLQDAIYASYTDGGDIIKFTSLQVGSAGNDITVTIEAGTSSGSKITLNEGELDEEVYDDVDMDETVPASYIIDVINSGSSLVSVERLSLVTDDTLPTNTTATNLTGGTDPQDIITFTAQTTGSDGNDIQITVEDGTNADTVKISISQPGVVPEVYDNLNMDEGVSSTYIVDKINTDSQIVTVTRDSLLTLDNLPGNVTLVPLTGGSDGAAQKSTITLDDGNVTDILQLDGKYNGTTGNYITVAVEDNPLDSTKKIFRVVLSGSRNFETFVGNMVEGSDDYIVDKINNSATGSQLVTATRLSLSTNNTLPGNIDFTLMSGGSNGSSLIDTDIIDGLDTLKSNIDIYPLTVGSYGEGTSNAVTSHLKSVVLNDKLKIGVGSLSPSTENKASIKTLAGLYPDRNMVYAYPKVKVRNPFNNTDVYVSPALKVASAIAVNKPEVSISQFQLRDVLGFGDIIQSIGNTNELDELGSAGVVVLGYKRGRGNVILNGYNSSPELSQRQIVRTNMLTFLSLTLGELMEPFLSKNHTNQYRIDITSAIKSYLETLYNQGRIGDPNRTGAQNAFYVQCDKNNNTDQTIKEGRTIVYVEVILLSPSDTIILELNAPIGGPLSISEIIRN